MKNGSGYFSVFLLIVFCARFQEEILNGSRNIERVYFRAGMMIFYTLANSLEK